MKKKLLAFFCALALLLAAVPAASALTGEQTRAADTLYTLGLIKGTADGYSLSSAATRAQAVTLLVRLAGAETAARTDNWISGFLDVPAWAEAAVNYASHQNWVSGVTSVRFSPNGAVTANAYCAFLLRMLGYSDKAGDFTVDGAQAFAQRIGLVSRSYSGALTRGELFEITADALTFAHKGSDQTVIQKLTAEGVSGKAAASALGLLNTELTARQVADRYTAAVFSLDCYEKQINIDAKEPTASASGFFISADGVAVTNYHSIDGDIYATATLSNGEVYPVEKVLYYDPDIDIAVIKISQTSVSGGKASQFAWLETAGTGDLRAGDVVYAIGNPLGLGLAISSGIVSDTSRTVERYKLPCIMDTADISQGSSGGALLNVYGQVVGVTSGAFVYGNNMYLAVPIDPVLSADLTGAGQTLAQVAAEAATSTSSSSSTGS